MTLRLCTRPDPLFAGSRVVARALVHFAALALAIGCGGDAPSDSARGGAGVGSVAGNSGSGGSLGASAGSTASAGGITGALAGAGGNVSSMNAGSGGSVAMNGGTGAPNAGTGPAQSGTGAAGAGGSTAPSSCTPVQPGACTAPEVRITEVDVGATVVVNDDDAALKLLSISPIPSGGSRVAWMGSDDHVHITTLDCDDHVTGDGVSLPAMDYGDIYADDAGGVVLLTRDAQGGGTLNCGTPANLCGDPPSPPIACYDMYMVRFDGTTETWSTKLSTSSAALPPYSTGPTGPDVYFIWWYAHHGRLAFDGTNWAGYYGSALSVTQDCTSGGNTAINIHQGDEMRVVSPSGALLPGHNSFDWGCSHSGFQKIVWDPGANRFSMLCRSDGFPQVGLNVNAQRQVSAISATDSAVSNLVLSPNAGSYWVLVTNMGVLHLFQFTADGGTTADVNLGNGLKPHLVKYGSHLLGAWTMGSNLVGQVLDASTGAAIGESFPIDVPGNVFQDFRDYSDGSAAYPAPGSAGTKIKIARVLPCSD